MEQQTEQIFSTIMKYEDPNISEAKKAQVMGWFQQICQPEFSLIDGLVTMFIDKLDSPELSMKILKILRKLNEHLPDLVCD
jgi:hypothetical protein